MDTTKRQMNLPVVEKEPKQPTGLSYVLFLFAIGLLLGCISGAQIEKRIPRSIKQSRLEYESLTTKDRAELGELLASIE